MENIIVSPDDILADDDGDNLVISPDEIDNTTPELTDLVQSMNPLEQMLVGAGHKFTNLGRGAANVFDFLTGDSQAIDAREKQARDENELIAPLMNDSLSAKTASFIPGAASMALPGKLPAQLAYTAGEGLIDYNPDQNQLANAAMALVFAGSLSLGGDVATRVMKAAGDKVAARGARGAGDMVDGMIPPRQPPGGGGNGGDLPPGREPFGNLRDEAERLGFKITPGQDIGSRSLRGLEASARANPSTADIIEKRVLEPNQKRLNQIVAEAIGVRGSQLDNIDIGSMDRALFGQAADDIAAEFSDVMRLIPDGNSIPVNRPAIEAIRATASTRGQEAIDEILNRYGDELSTGMLNKKNYSELVNLIKADSANLRGQSMYNAADDLEDLRTMIDDGLAAVTPPGSLDKLAEARRRLAYLKSVEAIATEGNIPAGRLRQRLKSTFRTTYTRGRADDDIMRAAEVTERMREIVGDSGTATRNYLNFLMSNPKSAIMQRTALRPLMRRYLDASPDAAEFYAGLLGANPLAEEIAQGSVRGFRGFEDDVPQ